MIKEVSLFFGQGVQPLSSGFKPQESQRLQAFHRPLNSSFWGLPFWILKIYTTKKELLRSLWVVLRISQAENWLAALMAAKGSHQPDITPHRNNLHVEDVYTELIIGNPQTQTLSQKALKGTSALNSKLQTLNPKPQTLNPQTLDPEPLSP